MPIEHNNPDELEHTDERGAPYRADDEQPEQPPAEPPPIALYDTEGHGYGSVYGPDEPRPFLNDDAQSLCDEPNSVLAE
jgi:hypothetical protein